MSRPPQAPGAPELPWLDLLETRRLGAGRGGASDFIAWAMGLADRSTAQLFQDLWVLWELGAPRGGYFCEFGATDGRDLSNTYLLETGFGWQGLLAEPNPSYHAALAANRACTISHDCVHVQTGQTVPFLCATLPQLSRMADVVPQDAHERTGRRSVEQVVEVTTVTLDDLFDRHGAPDHIDYLSLDTEGSEFDILQSLDFARRTVTAITVEHNGTALRGQIHELLLDLGYVRRFEELSRFDDWYLRPDLVDGPARPAPRQPLPRPRAPTVPAPSRAPAKATAQDFHARFREIVSDPLNLLIRRDPEAGTVQDGEIVLHNGNRVPQSGTGAYYGNFSDILVINRGVHEPLEEYVFQEVLDTLPEAPAMLELGAYWGHYSMWLKRRRPAARVWLVEPEADNLAAGEANFARNGFDGTFVQARVGPGHFEVDAFLDADGPARLDILHSDIQGAETAMLEGAAGALAAQRIDRVFVSTHGQRRHQEVLDRLQAADYRIEVAADDQSETTSFDGFVLASRPGIAPVFDGWAPLGRVAISRATPRQLVESLRPLIGE